ncbi:SH3 domain-containing protein [Streptomyces bullii]|uniref:SH3 domain-containing protein n=1 Tax=Streptomyces bullii TaxID=349910 RepID=A0ABW0UMH9_9ACTN
MSVDRVEEAPDRVEADRVQEVADGGGSEPVVLAVQTTAVTYYPVAPGYRLNVRSGPGTGYPVVRVLPEGAKVPIYCQTPGTTITGPYGTSNIWDNIDNGEYVSDAYVNTGSDGYVRPRCG